MVTVQRSREDVNTLDILVKQHHYLTRNAYLLENVLDQDKSYHSSST